MFPLRPVMREERTPLWREPALLLAGALIVLRCLGLPWVELFPEEAYYWNYAQHLAPGYLDHPPMVAWLIALGTAVFGQTVFGIRVFALGCSVATSVFAFRLAGLMYGRRAAPAAALLVQVLPFFFMTGWVMTPDAPLTACWAGTLYFLARVLLEDAAGAWAGAGACLGLGLLSKYTIALLGPATLLFLLLDPASRVWLRRGAPYAAALLALAIFSPVIVWNAHHHWASFAFQSTGRLAEAHRFALPALLASALLMLTPVGVLLAGRAWMKSGPGAGPGERRRRLFIRVFTLVPLAVFVLASLTHGVKLNWTGPLWLALVPALAGQLTDLARPLGNALRLGWRATVGILALVYVALFQYLSFGIPGLGYAANIALLPVGWSQMGRELERQQREVQRRTCGRVLIVGMDRDFIASEAAFYHSPRPLGALEATGPHLFEIVGLMYADWFPAKAEDGASLVLASFSEALLNSPKVRKHCGGLEPIEVHTLAANGKSVCNYYTRVVHDYKSGGYSRRARRQAQLEEDSQRRGAPRAVTGGIYPAP